MSFVSDSRVKYTVRNQSVIPPGSVANVQSFDSPHRLQCFCTKIEMEQYNKMLHTRKNIQIILFSCSSLQFNCTVGHYLLPEGIPPRRP